MCSSDLNNTFVGASAGKNNTGGFENSFFGRIAGLSNTTGADNSFFGAFAGSSNTTGGHNSFFGYQAGVGNTSGMSNVFVGARAGNYNATGDSNTVIGTDADVTSVNLSFATAIGAEAVVSNSNSVVLGRAIDTVRVPGVLNVTSSTILNSTVLVSGNAFFTDNVSVSLLGSAGSTNLCRNASDQISTCSSSLRYKTSVQPFISGLDIVRRLRPISFDWKDGGMKDVGFAAEEVEQVEPLLVTRNHKGEIEGVKYAQVTTVLVNAVREQQQIIEQQQRQIDALKRLVCLSNRDSEICKGKGELK